MDRRCRKSNAHCVKIQDLNHLYDNARGTEAEKAKAKFGFLANSVNKPQLMREIAQRELQKQRSGVTDFANQLEQRLIIWRDR